MNLALQPAVDQLMLVSGEDLAQQNYLLKQLPLKLQTSSSEVAEQAVNRTVQSNEAQSNAAKLDGTQSYGQQLGNQKLAGELTNQLEKHKSNKEIISEVRFDSEPEEDRFVSIALNFGQKLHAGQVQSICTSMLAIYSLVRRQPDLAKLNCACKTVERSAATTIGFYTLDNDERILSVAEVVQRSLSGAYKLESILKRTNRSTGSDARLHYLLVMNICLLFWLVVIVIMIGVLLASERLRSTIGRNRLVNLVRLTRPFARPEKVLNNKMNHIVIHNNLNSRPRYENEYVLLNSNQFDKQFDKPFERKLDKPLDQQLDQRLDQRSNKQFEKTRFAVKQNNCFVEQNKMNKQLSHSNVESTI